MRANYGGRYDKKPKKMSKETEQWVEKLVEATMMPATEIVEEAVEKPKRKRNVKKKEE